MCSPLVFLNCTFSGTEFSLTVNPLIARSWNSKCVLVIDKKIHQKVFSNKIHLKETGLLYTHITKSIKNKSFKVLGIMISQSFIFSRDYNIILFSRTKIFYAPTYTFNIQN